MPYGSFCTRALGWWQKKYSPGPFIGEGLAWNIQVVVSLERRNRHENHPAGWRSPVYKVGAEIVGFRWEVPCACFFICFICVVWPDFFPASYWREYTALCGLPELLFYLAFYDDPRAPLGVREVRDEQPHREKRSNPLPFDHGKYGNCHCHQCGFL